MAHSGEIEEILSTKFGDGKINGNRCFRAQWPNARGAGILRKDHVL